MGHGEWKTTTPVTSLRGRKTGDVFQDCTMNKTPNGGPAASVRNDPIVRNLVTRGKKQDYPNLAWNPETPWPINPGPKKKWRQRGWWGFVTYIGQILEYLQFQIHLYSSLEVFSNLSYVSEIPIHKD